MPEPSRVLLPILPESALDEIDEGQPKQGEPYDNIHVSLRKLQAATYQGTFLKAYSLLTEIAASIGWDQLLRTRSRVFVMEEEYRSERQHMATPKVPTSRNASTVALSGTPNGENESTNGASKNAEHDSEDGEGSEENDEDTKAGLSQDPQPNGVAQNSMVAADKSMEKPLPTIASEEWYHPVVIPT